MNITEIEAKIGIEFKNKAILENSFVHRSFLNEHKDFHLPSNEKLEFLGDSVLSLITSMYLYNQYPALQEGDYTEIKASIVRAESLATAAGKLGLGHYIYLSKGEEAGKGRANRNLLADCFEALIGAIFVDQGFDRAYSFVLTHLFKDVLDVIVSSNSYASSKSRLQEYIQSKYKITPQYRITGQQGPEHDRIFTVTVNVNDNTLAEGTGRTKKEAEEQAALNALEKLR